MGMLGALAGAKIGSVVGGRMSKEIGAQAGKMAGSAMDAGTNASTTPDVASGYLRHSNDLMDNGVLVHLRVHPEDRWFSSTDGNLRTRSPIPLSRVLKVTEHSGLS